MNQVIKKLGFKQTSEFYKQLAEGELEVNDVIDKYIELRTQEQNAASQVPTRSAGEFEFENPNEEIARNNDDVLVIDRNLKGIDYQLARCCNPIYGDKVF